MTNVKYHHVVKYHNIPRPVFFAVLGLFILIITVYSSSFKTLKDFKKMIQNEDANHIRQHNRKTCITL